MTGNPTIATGVVSKKMLALNVLALAFYLTWWMMGENVGNPWLYGLLLFGEIYHAVMALTFWYTLWPKKSGMHTQLPVMTTFPLIDIYITTAGEPIEILRETAIASLNLDYPNHRVYLLNDGLVARKDNWMDVEALANELSIKCITRRKGGGAKAGNINHALKLTSGEMVVIFDADMVPYRDFLMKTVPYLTDSKIGFVQTPQYYKNYDTNGVTSGAWQQQELFFGPIMQGKDRSNASFICGTNVVIRRKALEEVGGMNETSIAEDLLTSLAIHQKGWKSIYVREVLAEGLAPEDLLSYYKQQLRWARGSLEVLFSANPIFKRGLTWRQKTEYVSSALYYAGGLIVLIDGVMPLLYLAFGWQPVSTSTTSFALFFVPFMLTNLYTLYLATNRQLSFRALAFSHSSWSLQLTALASTIFKQKMSFVVTSKKALEGNFLSLTYPHLLYTAFALVAGTIAINREGINPSVITNLAWAAFNILLFIPYIQVSYQWHLPSFRQETAVDRV